MRQLFFALVLGLWPVLAIAQTYPEYTSTTVNDFASILTDTEQRAISTELVQLRTDTGIELVLVTLPRLSDYAPNTSMERFATNLFNTWGVGDKNRNDGIMVLVLAEDRAMRIELGAGFGSAWDDVAQGVIDHGFLPDFRKGNNREGIKTGITETVEKIARPFAANATAPKGSGGDFPWLIWFIMPLFAFPFRRKVVDLFARFRTCPSCHRRGGLRASSTTKRTATTTATGLGQRHVFCGYCDHSERSDYTISKRSKSRSSSFSGGSSSGGGASGKW